MHITHFYIDKSGSICYKFKLGIRYALLEPMDIVLISDAALGLTNAAVRVLQIEEDGTGELTITAEEIPGVTP